MIRINNISRLGYILQEGQVSVWKVREMCVIVAVVVVVDINVTLVAVGCVESKGECSLLLQAMEVPKDIQGKGNKEGRKEEIKHRQTHRQTGRGI